MASGTAITSSVFSPGPPRARLLPDPHGEQSTQARRDQCFGVGGAWWPEACVCTPGPGTPYRGRVPRSCPERPGGAAVSTLPAVLQRRAGRGALQTRGRLLPVSQAGDRPVLSACNSGTPRCGRRVLWSSPWSPSGCGTEAGLWVLKLLGRGWSRSSQAKVMVQPWDAASRGNRGLPEGTTRWVPGWKGTPGLEGRALRPRQGHGIHCVA